MAESNARLSDEMLDKRLFMDSGMLRKREDERLLWRFTYWMTLPGLV